VDLDASEQRVLNQKTGAAPEVPEPQNSAMAQQYRALVTFSTLNCFKLFYRADFLPCTVASEPFESLRSQAQSTCWRGHPSATANDAGIDLTPFPEMH
jgi:hypothetical protein